MGVGVGSVSPIKVEAVSAAVLRVFGSNATVGSSQTDSGVDDQPWGDQLTLGGAANRASAALHQDGTDVGIGIEAGLAEVGDGFVESISWVVAIGVGRDGTPQRGQSRAASYLLPAELAEFVRQGASLGTATRQLFGSQPEAGTSGPLTGGIVDRRGHYIEAILLALIPFYPHNAGLTFRA